MSTPPTDWTLESLSDLTLQTSSWNPVVQQRSTIRYIDVSSIDRDTLQIVGDSTVIAASAPSRARKIVRQGDTIFATVRPGLKRIALIGSELDGEIASTAFCVLRPNQHRIHPGFLFYAIQTPWFIASVSGAESGASYPAVRDTDVLKQRIHVPPRDEQILITSALDLCRTSLLTENESEAATRTAKQSVLRGVFTKGLRGGNTTDTELGEIPNSWKRLQLDDCAEVQTGATKGRTFTHDTTNVPYLRVANVQDGHLDLTKIKHLRIPVSEVERYRLHPGDVVLTEGGDFDKLGRGFIWRGELDLCIHQNHVFAVRTDRTRLLPEFFAYLAQSPYGKAYFLKVAHKTTNLACINSTKLKAFPVLVPPLHEQHEIVILLDAIDQKINLHRRKRAVLNDLFKTLLHKLMTGEIRVSDLDLSALESANADAA